jgi:hypothetical protein
MHVTKHADHYLPAVFFSLKRVLKYFFTFASNADFIIPVLVRKNKI